MNLLAIVFDPDEWGNVAEWVGAIGTLLAFGAAGLLLRHEHQIRRADAEERFRAQARKVSCWLDPLVAERLRTGPIEKFRHEVHVRNSSDEAIYHVVLTKTGNVNEPDHTWTSIGPGDTVNFGWMHGDPQPELYFFDASGNAWMREENGRLVLVMRASGRADDA